jgi:single-strand DNA-binding protein
MSVNKVILVGNVGKDPEVRYVDQNTPVANFTLATTERGYTTQNGTVVPERTEWHNIVVWRGLAKVVEGYVRKGTSLYIEGKIRTRNWTDQNGATRYTTEIFADELQLLGKRPEGGVAPLAAQQAGSQQSVPQSVSPVSAPPFEGESGDPANDLPF